jgi:hypothetical protein
MESVGPAEYGTGMQRHAGLEAIHADSGMAELYRLLTLKMVTREGLVEYECIAGLARQIWVSG